MVCFCENSFLLNVNSYAYVYVASGNKVKDFKSNIHSYLKHGGHFYFL